MALSCGELGRGHRRQHRVLIIGFMWFMPKVFGDRWIAYMGRPGEQLRPGPDFVLSSSRAP
jgi:hypothetical protein